MGISFLYIGRDEKTLKDRLLLDPRSNEVPLEMNFTDTFGVMARAPASNLSALFLEHGISPEGNLTSIFPTIPPDFNISEPFVAAPFPPIRMPFINFWSYLPGLPANFNISDPSMKGLLDDAIIKYLPELPKGFKLSKVLVPGGIIKSEAEPMLEILLKRMGVPNPLGDFGATIHQV